VKLIIEIEFGNDAMLRYSQARSVIRDGLGMAEHRAKPAVGDAGTFFNVKGNRVGSWCVVDAGARDAQAAELLWDSLKRDPEHKDRRQTGWGTKTMLGLVACLNRIYGGSNGQ